MNDYLFHHFRVITPLRVWDHGTVAVKGKNILWVDQAELTPARSRVIVEGNIPSEDGPFWLVPGFVDCHVHGGGGSDCLDGTTQAIETIARTGARGGTTAFLPTVTTAPRKQLEQALQVIRRLQGQSTGGAEVLGAHVEGPFFAPTQAGAQNPDFLRLPTPEDLQMLLSFGTIVKRVSLAPELPGTLDFGLALFQQGIQVAIGHSDATYQQVLAAIEHGFTHVIHLYSGMSGVKRINLFRVAGVIESALLRSELTVEVIADGKHLPPHLIDFILHNKGLGQVCAVTDAIRAAGMPEGPYELGGLNIVVEDGVAKLADRSAFAGSVATMDQILRTLVQEMGFPLEQAVQMTSFNPARFLGIADTKGTITPGKDADLVVLDRNLQVRLTMVQGQIVYLDPVLDQTEQPMNIKKCEE